jgi:hypothetical protein
MRSLVVYLPFSQGHWASERERYKEFISEVSRIVRMLNEGSRVK